MTDFLKAFTDSYERKARLAPMLVVLLPVVILLVVYVHIPIEFSLKSASAILLYIAVSSLMSSFARIQGKKLEPDLKTSWGGWPSMIILRHRDATIDAISKANIHKALAKSVHGTSVPTEVNEIDDPAAADMIYTAWSEFLRKLARNEAKKFPFVAKENASYGFQRNLLGVKSYGLILAVIGSFICSIAAYTNWKSNHDFPKVDAACLSACLALIFVWISFVTRQSVFQAAKDYACRLIDDCVKVPKPTTRAPKSPAKNEENE